VGGTVVEVWREIRPTFIRLVGDAVLFTLLMGSLSLGHYVIEWVPTSPENKHFLEGWHFRFIAGAWIFFSLTLFIELGVAFLKRMKDYLKVRE
jgi:hypothetical protein